MTFPVGTRRNRNISPVVRGSLRCHGLASVSDKHAQADSEHPPWVPVSVKLPHLHALQLSLCLRPSSLLLTAAGYHAVSHPAKWLAQSRRPANRQAGKPQGSSSLPRLPVSQLQPQVCLLRTPTPEIFCCYGMLFSPSAGLPCSVTCYVPKVIFMPHALVHQSNGLHFLSSHSLVCVCVCVVLDG